MCVAHSSYSVNISCIGGGGFHTRNFLCISVHALHVNLCQYVCLSMCIETHRCVNLSSQNQITHSLVPDALEQNSSDMSRELAAKNLKV